MASIFRRKSDSSASRKEQLSYLPGPRRSAKLNSTGVVPDGSGKRAMAASRPNGPRIALIAVIALVSIAVLGAIALFALSFTSAFHVDVIEAIPSEHLDAESIVRLSGVDGSTTLLNVDERSIEEGLQRNPWVSSVQVTRQFPDTLRIEIQERRVAAIVLMNNGTVAWNLGEDNIWIEPARIDIPEGESATSASLAYASSIGALLIYDVPATVTPKAGETAGESTVTSVQAYMNGFSQEFSSQIVSFSASSDQAIACTLSSGLTISLGEPVDIEAKERVVQEILAKYPDQVTYINVRVPSRPTLRKVGTDAVQAGSGVGG